MASSSRETPHPSGTDLLSPESLRKNLPTTFSSYPPALHIIHRSPYQILLASNFLGFKPASSPSAVQEYSLSSAITTAGGPVVVRTRIPVVIQEGRNSLPLINLFMPLGSA